MYIKLKIYYLSYMLTAISILSILSYFPWSFVYMFPFHFQFDVKNYYFITNETFIVSFIKTKDVV